MQTIQQERAKHAIETIRGDIEQLDEKKKKEYRAAARGLGSMVLSSGLGQAAAFYCSRGDQKIHKKLYDLLSSWLSRKDMPYENQELLEGITQGDLDHSLAAPAEALMYLQWVSMFASALIRPATRPGHPTAESNEAPETGEEQVEVN